jgi:hypothetical protein
VPLGRRIYPSCVFNCSATKIFWFGSCWGLRSEYLAVLCDLDVVKLVVNPPTPNALHCEKNLAELFASIQIALTLERIWRFRNQVVFQAKPDCPLLLIKNLVLRIVEHVQASLGESCWESASNSYVD